MRVCGTHPSDCTLFLPVSHYSSLQFVLISPLFHGCFYK